MQIRTLVRSTYKSHQIHIQSSYRLRTYPIGLYQSHIQTIHIHVKVSDSSPFYMFHDFVIQIGTYGTQGYTVRYRSMLSILGLIHVLFIYISTVVYLDREP